MQAKFDVDGKLIIGDRIARYSDNRNKKSTISQWQAFDGGIIWSHPNVVYYEPEYRDYIEDYDLKRKSGIGFITREIFWDHVVVTKDGVIHLFESDDPSHSSLMFCISHKYVKSVSEFEWKQYKDKLKDEWAKRNNVHLVRIPYTLSNEEKKELIYNALN